MGIFQIIQAVLNVNNTVIQHTVSACNLSNSVIKRRHFITMHKNEQFIKCSRIHQECTPSESTTTYLQQEAIALKISLILHEKSERKQRKTMSSVFSKNKEGDSGEWINVVHFLPVFHGQQLCNFLSDFLREQIHFFQSLLQLTREARTF